MIKQNDIETVIGSLNPAQREAVINTEGPMLVIAGAGSGKTRVLTTRIALLMSRGVDPSRILALTFTKKAAEEMRSRIIDMQGEQAYRITMGTFHSVFIRFMRPYAGSLGFPSNFTIMDEDDTKACLKRCIKQILSETRPPREQWSEETEKRFREEDKHYKPKLVADVISTAKNNLVTAESYARDRDQTSRDAFFGRPQLARIYREYRDTCFRSASMDFDDILLYTDIMLANDPNIRQAIASSYDYILVDEYQDTNLAQYSILRRLTEDNHNICVVGDDSQSIYAFRGARIQNIINFVLDYPGCRTVKLEQNYRSKKNIVNAANNLISRNENRIPKVCFSQDSKGDPINIHTCQDEKTEAKYIADLIQEGLSEGKNPAGYAVLYRTNAQSRVIEDALVKRRIPYMVYSGTSFFSRTEVKDLLAYFRLTANPRDDEAFLRVLNKPARGVGDAAQRLLVDIARAWNCSLYEAASNPQAQICGFAPKAMKGINEFCGTIQACIEKDAGESAYRTALFIEELTGFRKEFLEQGDEDSLKRADNIRELCDSVKSFEEDIQRSNQFLPEGQALRPDIGTYLENIMLLSNADTEDGTGNPDKVSLMTVHAAKGLEFDTVIIAGCEKELFPLEIEGTQFETEEERRLFYVAITRARDHLFLTKAESRLKYGKRNPAKPSPFLEELRPVKK